MQKTLSITIGNAVSVTTIVPFSPIILTVTVHKIISFFIRKILR